MKVYRQNHNLELIDVAPAITGFEKFIGTYVLRAEKIALIDVGPTTSIGNLLLGLAELNIKPAEIKYIFLTHLHIDHAGGIGHVIKQMPGATVVVHQIGKPHLADPTRLWEGSRQALGELALKYGPMEPVPSERMIAAEEGMIIDLGGMKLEVLITPGHASHHLSLLDRDEGRLFAGEAGGVYLEEIDLVRPVTASPFNLEQALMSLDKLISLAPRSVYYGHFGGTTQALDKLNYNKRQLILWSGVIADNLAEEVNWEDMYNQICEKDDALKRIDSLPPNQREREFYFIRNSINGLVDYFKKYGTRVIKQLI